MFRLLLAVLITGFVGPGCSTTIPKAVFGDLGTGPTGIIDPPCGKNGKAGG